MKIKNVFSATIESTMNTVAALMKEVAVIARFSQECGNIPELADVDYISVNAWTDQPSVTLILKTTCQDSKLIHKLAQIFEVSFEKKPSDYWQGLDARAESPDWIITICNYVPQACQLVEVEVIEPAQPARKRMVKKVVCGGGTASTA